MTDQKITDDEIIKALELCSKLDLSFEECNKCPYKGECGTKDGNMPADALALINRQKAEITRLITSNSQLEARVCEDRTAIERLQAVHADMTESLRLAAEANKDMQAEIERLKKIGNDKTSEVLRHDAAIRELHKQLGNAKSEAIKDFAQRLREIARMPLGTLYGTMVYLKDIDTLEKEMTEVQNES